MSTPPSILRVFVFYLSVSFTYAAFFYPTPQASLLEHILVDVQGAYASNFSSAITPCTNYVSGAQTFGRETAAQWLRVAFHDFVTADVKAGTGGIDASIGFETLRGEDSGSAFNDSLSFFRPFVTKDVSMADLIALSVSMSVGNCGGPQIPVRGGRVDATGAGAFGVPAPETDLALTLEYFESAGFDQVASIGLTACGHTLGSVHYGGFPAVVGPAAVTANNTAGGIHFDATVDIFDIDVVNEYLDGTGNAGGPLVTSFNITSRSDLRLYESDGNATMIELSSQGTRFLDTCASLLQNMIETVPSGVVLSEVVKTLSIKPVNATLDLDAQGGVVLTGSMRVLSTSDRPASLEILADNQSLTLQAEQSTGSSVFGTTSYFPFSIPISDPSSLSSFSAAGQTFAVQAQAFVVPSLSSLSASGSSANVTVAAKEGSSGAPDVKVFVPLPQLGTLSPKIITFDAVPLEKVSQIGSYDIWEGSVDFGDTSTGGVTVEVFAEEGVLDTTILY